MKGRIKEIILSCIMTSMILPILIACLYCGPSIDDFSQISAFKSYDGNAFLYPFISMIRIYNEWQGSYLSDFVCSFPVFNLWGIIGYRFWMFCVTALFISAFFVAIFFFMKQITITNRCFFSLLVMLLAFIYVVGFNELEQVFYWFNGSSVYTVPVIFTLFSFANYIKFVETQKKSYIILGAICAFLGSGGALDVPAFECAVLLLLVIYDYVEKHIIHKGAIIGAIALLGAVINTLAPGNFMRKDQRNPDANPVIAFINTVYRVNGVLADGIKTGFLLAIVITVFVIAYKYNEKLSGEHNHPVLVSIYCYFGILITDFPVLYGYGLGEFMHTRCEFIEAIAITLFVGFAAAYWGIWVSRHEVLKITNECVFILGLLCFISLAPFLNTHHLMENIVPYKMLLHIVGTDNDYAINASRQKNIVDQIVSSADEDVIVYSEEKSSEEWCNTKEIGITDDPTLWVNECVANYYGKQSVTLIKKEN